MYVSWGVFAGVHWNSKHVLHCTSWSSAGCFINNRDSNDPLTSLLLLKRNNECKCKWYPRLLLCDPGSSWRNKWPCSHCCKCSSSALIPLLQLCPNNGFIPHCYNSVLQQWSRFHLLQQCVPIMTSISVDIIILWAAWKIMSATILWIFGIMQT
jgi:hypothetical protein